MLRTDDLDYDLPERLIATRPHEPRDGCRLLVVSRSDPDRIEDRVFSDLPGLLSPGDRLVFNTSAVLPARFEGVRVETGGRISGLYIESDASGRWRVMLRSNSKLRAGCVVALRDHAGTATDLTLRLIEKDDDAWLAEPSRVDALDLLARVGRTPLPPYILNARRDHEERIEDELDRAWYQTVYADASRAGSVAAPTAGLHFTDRLLGALRARGVDRADVCLHVGPGTFKPVQTETLAEHPMHEERFVIPAETVSALSAGAGRTIAVGTTSVRAIESLPDPLGRAGGPVEASTRLMISPGYRFRHTGGLVTNFHLPRSTLMALVAAMLPGGVNRLKAIYAHAVREEYRFYSYGDAMLVLPDAGD
ncbi:MAG: tRNA preQ1(34) S-adenosylmethionine ribosyltransferase-isomerase QueA [Phycisphaerales bacterium]